MTEKNRTRDGQVQSVERAFTLLESLGQQRTLTLAELADSIGVHKTTVYRLLNTMTMLGYVRQDPETQKYDLGFKVLDVANRLLSSMDIRNVAQPTIRRLVVEVGTPVNLAVLSGGEVLYIEKLEGPDMHTTYSFIGKRAPVHCSALGKAMTAFLPREEVERILKQHPLVPKTRLTLTDEKAFLAHMKTVREKGWALDDEEFEMGIRCIATPIFDFQGRPVAGISTTGPIAVMTLERLEALGPVMLASSHEVSTLLGYHKS